MTTESFIARALRERDEARTDRDEWQRRFKAWALAKLSGDVKGEHAAWCAMVEHHDAICDRESEAEKFIAANTPDVLDLPITGRQLAAVLWSFQHNVNRSRPAQEWDMETLVRKALEKSA